MKTETGLSICQQLKKEKSLHQIFEVICITEHALITHIVMLLKQYMMQPIVTSYHPYSETILRD